MSINEIQKVIELANEYAGLSVQNKGTQTSYPYLDKIDKKFNV